MAHADWKRYYAVVYDRTPSYPPIIWRNRMRAWRNYCILRYEMGNIKPGDPMPIGIARIRANKRNPQIQSWLLRNAR